MYIFLHKYYHFLIDKIEGFWQNRRPGVKGTTIYAYLQNVHILHVVMHCGFWRNVVKYTVEDPRQKKQRNGWHRGLNRIYPWLAYHNSRLGSRENEWTVCLAASLGILRPFFPMQSRVFSSACSHRKKIRNQRAVLCQHESVDGGIICCITLRRLK